jgi:T5SS/PEP-CTERM-associated repeat protein
LDARCATETWNPGGAGAGNGTWDTSTPNWNSSQDWVNGNDALFSGTGGTVNLDYASANSLTFSASGPYILQGDLLVLTGSDIVVNSAATISCQFDLDTGLYITGVNTLTFTDTIGVIPYLNLDSGGVNIIDGGNVSESESYIGQNIGSNGTVTVSGAGTYGSSEYLYVGESGTGTLSITNGGQEASSYGFIGNNAGSDGNVTVAGSGSAWVNLTANLSIGYSGTGNVLISDGGTITNSGGVLGYNAGSSGSVTVTGSGSTWTNSGSLYAGYSGTGALLVTEGGAVSNLGGYLGYDPNSVGSVTVSGSGSVWTALGGALIGYSGTGTLLVTDGGAISTLSSYSYIGYNTGSFGEATLCGNGTTWVNGSIYIGDGGSGCLSINSGASMSDIGGYIANNAGSNGNVTVSGTGSIWTNSGLLIGVSGSGTLLVTGGGDVSNTGVSYVGYSTGGTGEVTVSGSGSAWNSTTLYVGMSSTGSLLVTAEGEASDSTCVIAVNSNSNGSVTISGAGSIWENGEIDVAELGVGTLLVTNGGAVAVSSGGSDIASEPGSDGTVTITGSGSTWTNASPLYIGTVGLGLLQISEGGAVSDTVGYLGYYGGSGSAVVSGSGSTWTNTGSLSIGVDGSGGLQVTGGGVVSNTIGDIAQNQGSNGSVTVSGSGSTWTNSNLYVGDSGAGTLLISDGASVPVSNGYTYIGDNVLAVGMMTVSGTGTLWGTDMLYVGVSGSASLSVLNGASVSDTDSFIAFNSRSTGSATISGPGSLWTTGVLYVGYSGAGALQVSNGGVSVAANNSYIGYTAGANGTVTVSGTGSTFTNGALDIGESGRGSLTITNGAAVSDISAYIGDQIGSNGTVTVSGIGSTWANVGLYVGYSGEGVLSISNGGEVSAADGFSYIGYNAGSSGTVTVSGSGPAWTNVTLEIGDMGNGIVSIVNGGLVSDTYGFIGNQPSSSGTTTVSGSGSAWSNMGGLYVGGNSGGPSGSGFLSITNGGAVNAAQTEVWSTGVLELSGNPSLNSPVSINGGTVALVDGQMETITLTNPMTLSAGSNLDFYIGYGSDQIALSGSGSLAVTGPAALNLYAQTGEITSGTDVLIAAVPSGNLSLNVYNGGNFNYSLLDTGTSMDVVIAAASNALTTAYWKGGQNNVWSVLVGGTATNWTTDQGGTNDPQLTPSATTDVVFSASSPAYAGDTLLGTNMTIKSLTISDTNSVVISGSAPNPWMGANTLTISGSAGTTGITINSGAGMVTLAANVFLSGTSQTVTVDNAAGLVVNNSIAGTFGLYVGGNPGGPVDESFLRLANGSSVSAAMTTIWDTGTLAIGEDTILNSPLTVDGGTLTMVDGQVGSVTLFNSATINAGSSLDFDVGKGSDEISAFPFFFLTVTGTSTVNLYGLSGLVTSGTDVLIGGEISGHLSLGNVYNSGNFNYSLLNNFSSEDVVVTATSALTAAYWKGGQNNLWSILVGGTATNWTTNSVPGANDPHLTPSATTDVYFSASNPANDGDTVLGTDMTIKSLTVSDPNAVMISGSDSDPLLPNEDTLTVSGSSGIFGITVNGGAGLVTIGANLYLSGSSQIITVNNAAGMVVSGTLGSSNGLLKSGTGALTLTGSSGYSGATIATGGTLVVNGPLAGTASTTITNATVAGTGSIANGVTIGSGTGAAGSALIVPGAIGLTGTLMIGGTLTLNSDAEFVFNLDSTNGGTGNGSSELLASSVSINPDSEFAFGDISSDPASLTLGTEFAVIDTTDGITGTFGNLPNDSRFTSGPNTYQATYSSNGLSVTVVPEPATWPMIFAGLGALNMLKRFRRMLKPRNA